MAAAANKNTGLILAVTVGGPALIAWLLYAAFMVTIGGSAVVATIQVITGNA